MHEESEIATHVSPTRHSVPRVPHYSNLESDPQESNVENQAPNMMLIVEEVIPLVNSTWALEDDWFHAEEVNYYMSLSTLPDPTLRNFRV